MMEQSRGFRFLYRGTALLALLLPNLAWGQATKPADELLAPALPVLRELLGDALPGSLASRTVSTAELQKTADPELAAILRFGPGNDASQEALFAARETLRPFWVAYYPLGSDRILLPPSTGELARWVQSQAPAGVEPAHFRREFVQLALVHEAVRLALDRKYDLARRFAECRNAEEVEALEALAEGRALAITRQAARRLGSEATLPLLTERFRQFVPAHPGNRWLIERHYRCCAWGLAFIDFADAQRIADAEQRVFAHPPAQLLLVQRPELYWQVEAPLRPGLEGRLARQAKTLPHWKWEWAPQPWTPEMVREVAELLGAKERADKCLAGWREAGSLVWRGKRNPRAELAVGAVRFADAKSAGAYYGLSIDLQREQDKLLNSTPGAPQRVIQSNSESVAFPGADDAVRTEKQFQAVGSNEPPIAVTTLLLRASDLVVLFTWQDVPANPAWASELLAGIAADIPQP